MWRYKYFRYTLFRIPQCYSKCTAGPWHKHVPNFSCPAIRIFSISGRPILRFFLKFKNQKKLVITPNTHSTPILTLLIPVLHSFCFVDSFEFWKDVCSSGLKGYAKSHSVKYPWQILYNIFPICTNFPFLSIQVWEIELLHFGK